MIVSGYSLHLYCDAADCAGGLWDQRAKAEFAGETASEARRRAREAGWRLAVAAGACLCPSCARSVKEVPSAIV